MCEHVAVIIATPSPSSHIERRVVAWFVACCVVEVDTVTGGMWSEARTFFFTPLTLFFHHELLQINNFMLMEVLTCDVCKVN